MPGCPTFVSAASLPSISPAYGHTRCRTTLLCTSVLHSTCYGSAAITAGYIGTRCTYAVHIAELSSNVQQKHPSTHLCPTFHTLRVCRHSTLIRVAEPRWYAPLSHIRTRCSYAVSIADLRSNALQNHPFTHLCPTFHTLRVCHHSTLIRVAEPRWNAPLSHIRTCCS